MHAPLDKPLGAVCGCSYPCMCGSRPGMRACVRACVLLWTSVRTCVCAHTAVCAGACVRAPPARERVCVRLLCTSVRRCVHARSNLEALGVLRARGCSTPARVKAWHECMLALLCTSVRPCVHPPACLLPLFAHVLSSGSTTCCTRHHLPCQRHPLPRRQQQRTLCVDSSRCCCCCRREGVAPAPGRLLPLPDVQQRRGSPTQPSSTHSVCTLMLPVVRSTSSTRHSDRHSASSWRSREQRMARTLRVQGEQRARTFGGGVGVWEGVRAWVTLTRVIKVLGASCHGGWREGREEPPQPRAPCTSRAPLPAPARRLACLPPTHPGPSCRGKVHTSWSWRGPVPAGAGQPGQVGMRNSRVGTVPSSSTAHARLHLPTKQAPRGTLGPHCNGLGSAPDQQQQNHQQQQRRTHLLCRAGAPRPRVRPQAPTPPRMCPGRRQTQRRP